jgi:predicted enzyme related to lactoylglutathione lyase
MVVHFSNAEFHGGHSYNSQVVDRFAEICVNDGAAQKVFFRNTFAWDHYQTRVVDIELTAGANTIKFSNGAGGCFAPNLDKIEIAPFINPGG